MVGVVIYEENENIIERLEEILETKEIKFLDYNRKLHCNNLIMVINEEVQDKKIKPSAMLCRYSKYINDGRGGYIYLGFIRGNIIIVYKNPDTGEITGIPESELGLANTIVNDMFINSYHALYWDDETESYVRVPEVSMET